MSNISEFLNTIDTAPSLSTNSNTTLFYPNNYNFSTLFPTLTSINQNNSFFINTSSIPSISNNNYSQAPVQMEMESLSVPTPIQITYPIPSPTPGPNPTIWHPMPTPGPNPTIWHPMPTPGPTSPQITWLGNGPPPIGWQPSWGATGTHPPGWQPSWGATGTHPPGGHIIGNNIWHGHTGAYNQNGQWIPHNNLIYSGNSGHTGHTGYNKKQFLITNKFLFEEKNFSINIHYIDDNNTNPKFLRRIYHLKYENIDIKVILKIDEETFEPVSNKKFDKIVEILEKLSRMNLYFSNICKSILVKDIFINKKIASRFEIEI